MKIFQLAAAIAVFASLCCTAQAYVLTFDDVPAGADFGFYYWMTYGINLDTYGLEVTDHTTSSWGPPNSGSNVVVVKSGSTISMIDVAFKGQAVWSVYSFGAFFSIEQDAVLQMVGYDGGLDRPVATAYIGGEGQPWRNRYVEISSPSGNISGVEIYPVSTDALHHFCLDDLTVVPSPEPSSVAALAFGLLPVGLTAARKRRRRD